MRNALLFALCVACNTLLPSQDTWERAAQPTGFILDAGEHELKDIIERASKFLGRSYLFEQDQQARGRRGGAAGVPAAPTIRLQKKLILDAIACEEIVTQFAYSRGFVVVPLDALRGIYEVISMRGQRAASLMGWCQFLSNAEVLRKSRMRILVETVVSLEHLSATRASQQLRPFFNSRNSIGDLQMGSTGGESILLLKGFAGQVARAIQILEKADVPEKPGRQNQGQPNQGPSGPPRGAPANYSGQLGFLHQTNQQQAQKIIKLEAKLMRLERLLGGIQLMQNSPQKSQTEKAQNETAVRKDKKE